MSTGRIKKALSGFYYVDTGTETLTCRARGKFRKDGVSPLVGDWVEVRDLGNGEGFLEKILPRRNAFARPAVANIDQLVVIASGAIPKTDPFLIDRVAAIAALKDCELILLLNKSDLDPDLHHRRLYHPPRQCGDRGGAGGAEAAHQRQALRLHRQLRRGQEQHSERFGP